MRLTIIVLLQGLYKGGGGGEQEDQWLRQPHGNHLLSLSVSGQGTFNPSPVSPMPMLLADSTH